MQWPHPVWRGTEGRAKPILIPNLEVKNIATRLQKLCASSAHMMHTVTLSSFLWVSSSVLMGSKCLWLLWINGNHSPTGSCCPYFYFWLNLIRFFLSDDRNFHSWPKSSPLELLISPDNSLRPWKAVSRKKKLWTAARHVKVGGLKVRG